ncbi:hypothetical protein ACHAWC_005975 [Mediolabrus comicus]
MHKTVYSSDRKWLGGQIFSGCRLKEGNSIRRRRRRRHQRHLSSDHHHMPMMILLLLVVTLTAAYHPGADAFQNAISSQPRRSCSHRLSTTRCNTATTLIDDMCESSSVAVGSSPLPPTTSSVPTSSTKTQTDYIQFVSPLLEDGYLPAVLEHEAQHSKFKPLLLYVPGFDGTILAPFLQFPSLGEEFDVRAMRIDYADRSTFEELKERIVQYLLRECKARRSSDGTCDTVYIMGESFGGILSTEVAVELNQPKYKDSIDLKGLVLVNPATCYLRSIVYELAPPIATAKPLIPVLEGAEYAFKLMTQVVPLFLNESRFVQQLIRISTFRGLPPVVNNAQREAYMGRVAFAIPSRLKFMPKETFQWRLTEWMERGCHVFEDRLEALVAARDTENTAEMDVNTQAMLKVSEQLRTTIVVGELDAMPSTEEAERLSSELFRNTHVHVVKGSGHISTCGGSLHLIELLRDTFPEINNFNDRKSRRLEELYGLEPRYDDAPIGMMPWSYWSKDYYKQVGN